MKNRNFLKIVIAICLLLGTGFSLKAQENDLELNANKDYTEVFDSLFAGVGSDKIYTGIWYERAAPFIDLISDREETILNKDILEQAWLQLRTAMYAPEEIEDIIELDNYIRFNRQNDILLLGSIHARLQHLNANAFDGGHIVEMDSLYFEGENAAAAFDTKAISLAGIWANTLEAGKTYTLQFSPRMMFQKDIEGVFVTSITLETFSGTMTLYPNGQETWTIPTDTGMQSISMEINLSNGEKVYGSQKFYAYSPMFKPTDLTHPSCNPKTDTIEADIPYKNIKGHAAVTIYYHSISSSNLQCERKIKKPIIFLDGIDNLSDGEENRDADKIYTNYLYYTKNSEKKQIGDSLRLMGYDLIFFDPILYQHNGEYIDGGDDYMQRNAFILVKLIQQIKDSLMTNGSNEDLVIIGPSMGGQISRYALLYMEQQWAQTGDPVWDPKCRLWIAFDSPNDGANIPISIQQYLTFWGNKVGNGVAQKKLRNYLQAPASQQLLIHQLQKMDGTKFNKDVNKYLFANTNPLRQTWLSEIAAMGNYPSSCRKIALSNGKKTSGYHKAAGSIMFDFETYLSFYLALAIGESENYFLPKYAPNTEYPTFTGSLNLILEANLFIASIGIFTSKSELKNNSIYGALDVSPGSYYEVQKEIYESVNTFSWTAGFIPTLAAFSQKTNVSTFIPTVSSLGLKDVNFNWGNSIPSGNLVCDNLTYFDNYYVPSYNQGHMAFTEASWQWVKREIENREIDCMPICKSYAMHSNDLHLPLCIYDTRTLYHNYDLPPGATTTWSVADNPYDISIISSNDNSVVVEGLSSNAKAKVRYKITNSCSSVEGSIVIGVGTPGYINLYCSDSILGTNKVKINNYYPNAVTYYWGLNGANWGYKNSEYYPGDFIVEPTYNPNYPEVCLKSSNSCGEFIYCIYPYLPAAGPLNAQTEIKDEVIVYPNPGKDKWMVTFTNINTINELKLYNYDWCFGLGRQNR